MRPAGHLEAIVFAHALAEVFGCQFVLSGWCGDLRIACRSVVDLDVRQAARVLGALAICFAYEPAVAFGEFGDGLSSYMVRCVGRLSCMRVL